jgi:uncharacterized protein (TIGR01244 family)
MKPLLQLILAVAAASVAAAGSPPERLPSDALPHYRLVTPNLATGGQPSGETVAMLKEMGFKTIVNLRPADEAPDVAREKAAVELQGLRYVSIPITAGTFSAEDVEAVRSVLDDEEAAPVLLHCSSANRAGAVWGVIERRRGRELADAEAEARKIGLSSPAMIEAFQKVVNAVEPMAEGSAHRTQIDHRHDEATGIAHEHAVHHFLLTEDGGSIALEIEGEGASEAREHARTHLQGITRSFASGDFSMPIRIHDRVPPGVEVMTKRGAAIHYDYSPTANGGKVRISTRDAEALAAIHEFLRFQIRDHGTSDPTN